MLADDHADHADHADHDLRSQVLAAFDGEAHVSAVALSDELGVALNKVCDTIDALARDGLIYPRRLTNERGMIGSGSCGRR